MSDKDRIERLEVVLTTLISWLPRELGTQAQGNLFNMLQTELKDDMLQTEVEDSS